MRSDGQAGGPGTAPSGRDRVQLAAPARRLAAAVLGASRCRRSRTAPGRRSGAAGRTGVARAGTHRRAAGTRGRGRRPAGAALPAGPQLGAAEGRSRMANTLHALIDHPQPSARLQLALHSRGVPSARRRLQRPRQRRPRRHRPRQWRRPPLRRHRPRPRRQPPSGSPPRAAAAAAAAALPRQSRRTAQRRWTSSPTSSPGHSCRTRWTVLALGAV